MVWAEHGRPAQLIVVARMFRFRSGTGYGVTTEQGYLAVKTWRNLQGDQGWHLEVDSKRVCLMEARETTTPDGAVVPCLAGQFGLAWYILLGNPPDGRKPQATLYLSVYPPR